MCVCFVLFFFCFGQRIKELQSSEPEKKLLRLGVETGGCSGFQYVFELDHKTNPDDRLLSLIDSPVLHKLVYFYSSS